MKSIAVLTLLSVLGLYANTSSANEIIVKENNFVITEHDLDTALKRMGPAMTITIKSEKKFLRDFVKGLYASKVIIAQAVKMGVPEKLKLKSDDEAVINAYVIAEMKKIFLENTVYPDFTQQAFAYYQTHLNEFAEPEKRRAAHILLHLPNDDTTDAKTVAVYEKANEIIQKIQEGVDFEKLVKQYSEDATTVPQAGEFPRAFSREEPDKAFAEAIFTLSKPGDTTDVIKTPFGLHIAKLLEILPQSYITFEAVQEKIEADLKRNFLQERGKEFSTMHHPTSSAEWNETIMDKYLVPLLH